MASAAVLQPCPLAGCAQARQKLAELRTLRDDAEIADAAYADDPPTTAGGKTHVMDRAGLAAAGLQPEDLVIPGTNFRAVVYKEGAPPRYTVGFQGTDPLSLSDLLTNAVQAFGGHAEYYVRAQDIANKMELARTANIANAARNREPADFVQAKFVGHSLGGGLASAASATVGGPATTFNAAGLHDETVMQGRPGGKVVAVRVRGEGLTAVQQASPLPKARSTRPVVLDPPFSIARDVAPLLLIPALGGLSGVALGIAARSVLLHTMGAVKDSLEQGITEAEVSVAKECGGL